MTIVEDARAITGGVDTHSEVHVAAALDPVGGLLGTREFPASEAGYDADLLVVDGDPAADIGALSRPVAVFAGGHRQAPAA